MALRDLDIPAKATIAEVRKMKLPTVSSLVRKENGVANKTECYTFLAGMIVLLNQFFGTTWSDEQVKTTARDLYSDYYYWSLGDWKLFAKKCHRCELDSAGKLFGAWSPDKLLSWALRYDQMWMEYSSEVALHNHDLDKKQEEGSRDMTWSMRTEAEQQFQRFAMQYDQERRLDV